MTKAEQQIVDILKSGGKVTVDNVSGKRAKSEVNGQVKTHSLDTICSLLKAGNIEIVDSWLVTEYGLKA